jgi:hypothetical protein
MNQDTAYKVMMGFASKLRLKCHMDKVDATTWQVVVYVPGQARRILKDVTVARRVYAQLAGELKLPL